MSAQAPAVVTPLDEHMGLDIARSLAKKGIRVYGIDHDPRAPGRYSNACRFVQCPDPERNEGTDYIDLLADFGRGLDQKAVLYPLSDRHVLLCSEHRSTLQRYYNYVMPDAETLEQLTTKDGLRALARTHGIPAPQTYILGHAEEDRDDTASGDSEIEAIARDVRYPAILKPTESTYWHTPEITQLLRRGLIAARAKVLLCQTPEELLDAYRQISAYDDRMIVQEVIPGEDSRLVYFSCYLNRESQPLGIFGGRKHRVIPTGFGSASYVRSLYDPELKAVALKLLYGTHYQGLVGIEFKKDPRDEVYKLIEVNTRFGMWDGLGVRCGVDLPYIAYRDALNLPVEPQLSYREEVIWIDWQRDVRAAIAYRRRGELSLLDWLRSLRGEKMWAIYSGEDWRPGAAFTLGLIRKLWDRVRPHATAPAPN